MQDLTILTSKIGSILTKRQWKLATAESCTGGLLSATLTSIPGSSQWFDRAYVTYSNVSKTQMLGVEPHLLASHGAVSAETAEAMAEGALAAVDTAIAVTGVAGPDGGSPEKPVGTVWIAWASRAWPTKRERFLFRGDRAQIREQTVETALTQLVALLT